MVVYAISVSGSEAQARNTSEGPLFVPELPVILGTRNPGFKESVKGLRAAMGSQVEIASC